MFGSFNFKFYIEYEFEKWTSQFVKLYKIDQLIDLGLVKQKSRYAVEWKI